MTALEEIKKALEGVTPGPWEVYSEKVADKAAAIAESAYQVEHTEPFVGEIFMLNGGGKCPALTGCGPCSEANARYIAAVNPAVIAELIYTLESLRRDLNTCQEQAVKDGNEIGRLKDWQAGAISCREAEQDRIDEYKSRAEAAEAEVKRLRERLKPFSQFAGVLFERNFNRTDSVAEMTDVDSIPHAIFAASFFDARTALASTGGEHHAE